jgi:hypothetical protein
LIFHDDYAALRQRRCLPDRRGVILRASSFTPTFAFVVGSGLDVPAVPTVEIWN